MIVKLDIAVPDIAILTAALRVHRNKAIANKRHESYVARVTGIIQQLNTQKE